MREGEHRPVEAGAEAGPGAGLRGQGEVCQRSAAHGTQRALPHARWGGRLVLLVLQKFLEAGFDVTQPV